MAPGVGEYLVAPLDCSSREGTQGLSASNEVHYQKSRPPFFGHYTQALSKSTGHQSRGGFGAFLPLHCCPVAKSSPSSQRSRPK